MLLMCWLCQLHTLLSCIRSGKICIAWDGHSDHTSTCPARSLPPTATPPPPRTPAAAEGEISNTVSAWLNPPKEELPDDFEMPIWDHLDELRERVLVRHRCAAGAVCVASHLLPCSAGFVNDR